MSRFVKVFVPLFVVALGAAIYLLPGNPTMSRRTAPEKSPVSSRPTALPPAAGRPAVAAAGPQAAPAGPEATGMDDVDLDSPPTPAEARQFVDEVGARMARLGIDSTQPPPDLRIPAEAAQSGFAVDPTPKELEQMKKDFAETEKALRNLDRETPRDPQPPATK